MTWQCCAACLAAPWVLLVAYVGLRLVVTARPRPALRYPVGRDACHPLPGVAVRPVPPVLPPAEYAAHARLVADGWGPDVLDIPHGAGTERVFPYCDWQGNIQDRRN